MPTVTMKRHEWWRHNYRQARDLDHLSAEELSERLHDCINNIRTRTEREKLGLLPVNESAGEAWMILFTEVLEECNLRGYAYPGPITIAGYRSSLDHAFDPIPDMDRVLDEYGLRSKPYLLKFGEPRWLVPSIERGKFRIASASYYDSAEHNHARRDTELQRFLRPNPRCPRYVEPQAASTLPKGTDSASGWTSIASPTDYLLFSLSAAYSSRLFGDFAATSCLVIFDPKAFLNRLLHTVVQQLPGWHIEFTGVTYYDPVRVTPTSIVVPKAKPFRHAYQQEMRLVCLPPASVAQLSPLEIEIGPLADCATLVDLTTHPPPPLPHDPSEDPIQVFGNVNAESSMVHRLPDAARVQGIVLNKSAQRHEDWYFQIQYTDDKDVWHELKVPMLDALYLLNLLRAAEKEQHLGLWNRE
jgi:hypothetical protein